MPENAETTTVHEPRKLGFGCKALVAGLVVLTAGLAVGAVVAKRVRQARRHEPAWTVAVMKQVAHEIQLDATVPPVRSATSAGDATGQKHLRGDISTPVTGGAILNSVLFGRADENQSEAVRAEVCRFLDGEVLLDAWGNPFHYRCPGPIHKNGWDLISCGPNGIYEEGGGDDIVVGDDLPGGLAAISSESVTATEGR